MTRPRPADTVRRTPLPLFVLLPLALAACDGAASHPGGGSAERGLVILNPGDDPRDYFHDFGTLPYGEKRTHTFRLKNTDSRPVTIHDLQPSCTCAVGRLSYTDEHGEPVLGSLRSEPVIVLPPGVEADLTFEVDTTAVRLANRDKLATARLRCDSVNTPFISFEMHLEVDLDFQATPATIDLKRIPVSTGARGESGVIAAEPEGRQRITGVLESPAGLVVGIREEPTGAGTLWTVEATLAPPLERGLWKGTIVLSTTGEDGEGEGRPFEIPVIASVVDDIVLRPATISFSRFSTITGSVGEAEVVALAPGHRTKVVAARLEGELPEGVAVRCEPVKPDPTGRSAAWKLTVTVPPSVEARKFAGKVVVDLDDSMQERVEGGMIFNP